MKDLLFKIIEEVDNKKDLILMSIVTNSGSTPREAGSRMLLFSDGSTYGTIGGGSVEFNSTKYAKKFLEERKSNSHSFLLTKNEVEDIGMVCGGSVGINFYYISHEDKELVEGIKEAYKWAKNNYNFIIIESVEKGISFIKDGQIFGNISKDLLEKISGDLDWANKSKIIKSYDGAEFFIEKIHNRIRVVLFGAGHVSEALAPILTYLDFDVVVCDDRMEFLTEEKFPTVSKRIFIDFENIEESLEIKKDDYICVLTRGHKFDEIVQAQMLKTRARYIGVIGSRRKKKSVDMRLKNRGFTDDDIARITSPIGIDMACETPREIGISIAAQLVDLRLKQD